MRLETAEEHTIAIGQARVQGVVTTDGMAGWVLPGMRFTRSAVRAREVARIMNKAISRP